MLDPQTVINAAKFILGRDLFDEKELELHLTHHNFESLRKAFFQTNELKSFFKSVNNNDFCLPLFMLRNDFDGVGVFAAEPTLSAPSSQLCTASQFDEKEYLFWCNEMLANPIYHRKQWEFVWILAVLKKIGILSKGHTALGFGTGSEPIPSILAKYGVKVTASDAPEFLDTTQGWSETNQHSSSVQDLYKEGIVDRTVFEKNVSWRPIDMNSIPIDLIDYDVCWSACALEHLGSIKHGLDFIINSLETLKPGGFAIHTTEFNLSSNDQTLESTGLSFFRKKDIIELCKKVSDYGHKFWPVNLHPGFKKIDEYIDLPPYSHPHLKLISSGYTITSIGLVIQKGQ